MQKTIQTTATKLERAAQNALPCAGTMSRDATKLSAVVDEDNENQNDTASAAAEDKAIKAARDAAGRACAEKKCEDGKTCLYVEDSSTGGSEPVPVPPKNPADPNEKPKVRYRAKMFSSGRCVCGT